MFESTNQNIEQEISISGTVKAIFRRGVKYAEEVRNSTKTCISLMICGNAVGDMGRPYVVYKGPYVYPVWTENGPPGTVYSSTISGSVVDPFFLDLETEGC